MNAFTRYERAEKACFVTEQTAAAQTDKPEEREPQVVEQISRIQSELAYQSEVVSMLAQRLQALMSPCPPDKDSDCKAAEPTCPAAAILAHEVRRIQLNTSAMQSFLRRLEI